MNKTISKITICLLSFVLAAGPMLGLQTAEARYRYSDAKRDGQNLWNDFIESNGGVGDKVANQNFPIIKKNGIDHVQLHVGDEYIDQGAVAVSSSGADISADMEVRSNVDTSKPGDYFVEYFVKDDSDFTAYDRRRVHVLGQDECFLPYMTSPEAYVAPARTITVSGGRRTVRSTPFTYYFQSTQSTSTVQYDVSGTPRTFGYYSNDFEAQRAVGNFNNNRINAIQNFFARQAYQPQLSGTHHTGVPVDLNVSLTNDCGSVETLLTIFSADNPWYRFANTPSSGAASGGETALLNALSGLARMEVVSRLVDYGGFTPQLSAGFQPFGGRILQTIQCHNGILAFMQLPFIPSSGPGPYGVWPAGIKPRGNVAPSFLELGLAYPGGVCMLIIGGFPVFLPLTHTVSIVPGMGTS